MNDQALKIKQRLPISQVVKEVVMLKGKYPAWVGLCPFHEEKTPSFNVRDNAGRFKCFGCGASGDVFEFLMKLRGISFKEALAELAQKVGLNAPVRPARTMALSKENALLKAQHCAQDYFSQALSKNEGQGARKYLIEERGLSEAMIRQAGIGFSGMVFSGLREHLKKHGISDQVAIDAGLIKNNLDPVFLGRVTFPIRDQKGRVVAFGARSLSPEQNAKYINTHNYSHYEKRKVFYGLFESRTAIARGQVPVLVEGYFDAMAMWAIGMPALALCGTSFSSHHAQMLVRLSHRIIVCFDADRAGLLALKNSLMVAFSHNLITQAINLSGHKDPGDFLAGGLLPELKSLLAQPADALTLLIDQILPLAAGSIDARMRQLDDLIPLFSHIKRPLLRRQYVAYVAQGLHEDPGLMWAEVQQRIKSLPKIKKAASADLPSNVVISNDERVIVQILMADAHLLPDIMESFVELSPDFIKVIQALVGFIQDKTYGSLVMEQWFLTHYPGLWPSLREMMVAPLLGSQDEARHAFLGLIEKQKFKTLKQQLHIKRKLIEESAKANDFSAVLQGLREKSSLLLAQKRLRPPSTLIAQKTPKKEVQDSKPVAQPAEFLNESILDGAEDWMD